jgi:hypothetical protein
MVWLASKMQGVKNIKFHSGITPNLSFKLKNIQNLRFLIDWRVNIHIILGSSFATIGGYAYSMFLGDGKSYRKRLSKKRSKEVCILVHGNKTFAFLLCSLKLNINKYEQNVQVDRHKANHNS